MLGAGGRARSCGQNGWDRSGWGVSEQLPLPALNPAGSGPGPPGAGPRDASSEGAPGTAGGSPEQGSPLAHSPSSQGGRSRSAAVSESHATEADADAVAALLAATARGLGVGALFDWQPREGGSSGGPETASAAGTTPGGGRRAIDVSQLPPIKDRVRWTPELHQLFVDAVEQLGGSLKAKVGAKAPSLARRGVAGGLAVRGAHSRPSRVWKGAWQGAGAQPTCRARSEGAWSVLVRQAPACSCCF